MLKKTSNVWDLLDAAREKETKTHDYFKQRPQAENIQAPRTSNGNAFYPDPFSKPGSEEYTTNPVERLNIGIKFPELRGTPDVTQKPEQLPLWRAALTSAKGGLKGSGAAYTSGAGTITSAMGGTAMTGVYTEQVNELLRDIKILEAQTVDQSLSASDRSNAKQQLDINRNRLAIYLPALEENQNLGENLNTAADDIQRSSAADLDAAKQGRGFWGRALMDATAAGTQMIADRTIGAPLGNFGGMAALVGRSFGGGAQEARQSGGDINDQLLYGGLSAATEYATEKMFNVSKLFKGTYGNGAFDDVVEKAVNNAISKAISSPAGRGFAQWLAGIGLSVGSEATEEAVSGLLSPVWQRLTFDPNAVLNAEEIAYDALIGGMLGGVGGAVDVQKFNVSTDKHEVGQQPMQVNETKPFPSTQRQALPSEMLDAIGVPMTIQEAVSNPPKDLTRSQESTNAMPTDTDSKAQSKSVAEQTTAALGEHGLKAFKAATKNSETDVGALYPDFVRIYNGGRSGNEFSPEPDLGLTSPQQYAAWVSGQNDAQNTGDNTKYVPTQPNEKLPSQTDGGIIKTNNTFPKLTKKSSNLLTKWANNEWVNIDLEADAQSDRAKAYHEFFRKFYNAGFEGKRIIDLEFSDTDIEFPAFLQDVFFEAGQEDAGRKSVAPNKEVKSRKTAQTQITSNMDAQSKTAHQQIADDVKKYIMSEKDFSPARLYEISDKAYGGTMADGTYTIKDVYDAMELAVNQYLVSADFVKSANGNANTAVTTIGRLEKLLANLPTQNKRTEEMEQFQQFSTPPNIAYLAAWAANITGNDVVLEPSAGIGGLALWGKAWGAEVYANELSERRLNVLNSLGLNGTFNFNAEQIDNRLPDNIKPSIVIMNPPFSSTAGRTNTNKTANAKRHIEQALLRLKDNGRLVAILGQGMSDNSASFKGWWDELRQSYSIRANLSIDGANYRKYGTTFGVQLVVIDKTGPQQGDTITGTYKDLTEIPKVLEDIRNDRIAADEHTATNSRSITGLSTPENGVSGRGDSKRADRGSSGGGRKGTVVGDNGRRTQQSGADREAIQSDGLSDNRQSVGNSSGNVSGTVRSEPEQQRTDRPDTQPARSVQSVKPKSKSDNGVFAEYVAPKLPVSGVEKHPARLVESAAMAAVGMPEATYKPNLPKELIETGALSDVQLTNIVYAGQAHQQILPDGKTRKGYFIGDGTGVGKGRQIAGIILDNQRQGRTKAVWVSKSANLFSDAQRDWVDIGGGKDEVFSLSKAKLGTKIKENSGILFSSYDTLSSEKADESRLKQIVDWLGTDFDGVIAFDEAHNMGNLLGKRGSRGMTKPSAKALAGVELQKLLPNARVVYVSATAATDVNELAFAQRLGLWGNGTQFADVNDFVSKIGSGGLAAMELVARDMKSLGVYQARSISFDGVQYDTLKHDLSPMQTQIYDTMCKAWQVTLSNIYDALKVTGGNNNPKARGSALSAYYGTMQRFYNQILTSMSMPTVIADIKNELEKGHSCVLQIVNTNQAESDRQLAKAKEQGTSLEELDLTPKGTLLEYLKNSFPINAYEDYTDDTGNLRSRLVTDNKGNPVIDKQALTMRDALISNVEEMSVPEGPLEMLFDAFGTERVAEITGRSRRVVPHTDESGEVKLVEEKRTANHVAADVQAFQDGKKRILIFSDAGGTGKSYHADLRAENQEQRIHYLVQPGWSAPRAVQGFGRTNRSNQASAPTYKLITTNIKGQKRFVSTIARRLDQLGALTKGQRQTGSGMFGAKDNLESDLARDSLRNFYENLGNNRIPDVDGMGVLKKLGLDIKFTDEYGNFKINEDVARDMNTFLNRILALEVDEQNAVFDEFNRIFESNYDAAMESGSLDLGLENVKADKIEILDNKVIRTDESTGATTNYVQAKTYRKPSLLTTIKELQSFRDDFQGLFRTDKGDVRAVYRIANKTDETGKISKMFRLQSAVETKSVKWNEETLGKRASKLDKAEWVDAWKVELEKAPEYEESTIHMLTGTLLPIWNRLPREGNTRVMRIVADDGSQYLGRVIAPNKIDDVLRSMGVTEGRTKEVYTPAEIINKIMHDGAKATLTDNRVVISRRRVSGENRMEITGQNLWYLPQQYNGIITETINYNKRYFIPTSEKGEAVIAAIIKDNPVIDVSVDNISNDVDSYRGRNDKNAHIQADMSGKQRYEILKNKSIRAPHYDKSQIDNVSKDDYIELLDATKAKSFTLLRKIGEQFGVFKRYNNEDVELEFNFSKRNLKESLNKQNSQLQNYVKMLTVIDEVIESAIGIEVHKERYSNADSKVDSVYVLASAFRTDDGIVPVLLEVKTFLSGEDSTLHIAVSLSEIERSRIVVHTPTDTNADKPYTLPASVIKVADLFANVNAQEKRLLKYIPDDFLNSEQLKAKKIALAETANYIEQKNVARYNKESSREPVDKLALSDMPSENWNTDRIGSTDKNSMPLSDIVNKVRHDFGIPVTTGNIHAADTNGQYNRKTQGIRTRIANSLPVVAHELGHHLDNKYKITANIQNSLKAELVDGLTDEFKSGYKQEKWKTEGLAEFFRKYLQNSETAAIDYPQFTEYFRAKLNANDLKLVDELANEVNAYYALDAESATSAIRFRNEGSKDFRSFKEKLQDVSDKFYQTWVDSNHGIKMFDEAVGSDTYKLASNSAYSDSIAHAVLTGDLTNINGQRVGDGLARALYGVNIKDEQEYRFFGEYLVVKHGPERLKEGMRIFADDRKNSTAWMNNRKQQLEVEYPQFKTASEKLYEFQDLFLKTWGVETGLVAQKQSDSWKERWSYYVPLNRAVGSGSRYSAKRQFANQKSIYKRAKGSGLDVIHPVDNIINNIVLMINAGARNNVMREITNAASARDGTALFLEKVPAPLKVTKVDLKDVKNNIRQAAIDKELSKTAEDAVFEIVDNIDDILMQYSRGKAFGDTVTVMKNGKPEFWKINDPLLLASVSNMAPSRLPGWIEAYGRVSRFMTSNITGSNLIWSIGSNMHRDIMTYFTYSEDKNPLHIFGGIGSAYINKVKGSKADPLFKEYISMGGGQTSAYTADKNLARDINKKLTGEKLKWLNPLEWVEFAADTIELGPRFSYYKILRNKGLSAQEAFYGSQDITVNFRRGGVYSRQINKVIPFFNAGVQGLDKFARWLSAADAPSGERVKVVRGRMIGYVTASAVLATLMWAINGGAGDDDEKKKEYAQLSNYTKNNFWCIPIGGGKFITIPKPREIAVLTSLFETIMERTVNGNDDAFDEFYNYIAETALPNVISDVAQGDLYGAIGSLGIIGTGAYMMANRDFLGKPIVSASQQSLEKKDQYTARTSKLAYWIGQAFNVSPTMADYFFRNILGGWWKTQASLFPVGNENVDYTLGLRNSYVRDNLYSTDLVNNLYNASEKAAKRKRSNPGDVKAAITSKNYDSMTDFYARYSKLAKGLPDTTANRATRQTVLDMVYEFNKSMESSYQTSEQKVVEDLCAKLGTTENMPSVMQTYVKGDDGNQYNLSAGQYVEYQTEYLGYYWSYAAAALEQNRYNNLDDAAALLNAAKNKAKDDATSRALKRMNVVSEKYEDAKELKNAGIPDATYIRFKAALDIADDDGSLKQADVIKIIDGMKLTDEQKSYLFHSKYDSDKNNPWR